MKVPARAPSRGYVHWQRLISGSPRAEFRPTYLSYAHHRACVCREWNRYQSTGGALLGRKSIEATYDRSKHRLHPYYLADRLRASEVDGMNHAHSSRDHRHRGPRRMGALQLVAKAGFEKLIEKTRQQSACSYLHALRVPRIEMRARSRLPFHRAISTGSQSSQ